MPGFAGATPLGRPLGLQFRLPTGRALWAAYCTSLMTRPLLTKCSTSLAGFCLGDCIAQNAAGRSRRRQKLAVEPYDMQRTMRLAFYGGCVAGPIGHFWFNFLDKVVFPKASTSVKAIASKIALDQIVMAPVGTTLFYIVTSVLQGETEQVPDKLKEKFVPTLAASYTLWPAAHAINFKFVPSSQRILYTNVVSILWTYILSQAAAATVTAQQPVVKGEEAEPLTLPQQVAVFLTEEEQVSAMQLVVEELASSPQSEDATSATAAA